MTKRRAKREVIFYGRFGQEVWKEVLEGDDSPPKVYTRLSLCLSVFDEVIDLCEKKA